MKNRKGLVVVVAILVLAVLAWRYFFRDEAASLGLSPDLVSNRLWVDSQPEKYTDSVHLFFMIDAARIGAFQETSQYRGRYELFDYKRSGAKADLVFPQDGRAESLEYTITECTDLHPYDLCLDLKANPWGGPTRYYGMRDDDSSSEVRSMRHRMEALLRAGAHRP